MFREIRRKEKQLTIEECHEILSKAEFGTLATTGSDGYPYAVSNSVVIFGKAKEVIEREKLDGLIALLKKFLSANEFIRYEEEGIQYIEKSLKRTKLIKIEIEHMTGKRGIRDNKQIQGKQH